MKVLVPALGTAALAAFAAVAAHSGTEMYQASVVLIVVCLALGWASLAQVPLRALTAGLVLASGAAAIAMVVLVDPANPLPLIVLVLAGSVFVSFLIMLLLRLRAGLTRSVTGMVMGQTIAVMGAGWLVLPHGRLGVAAVTVAAAGVAGAALGAALPVGEGHRGWAGLVAGLIAVTAAVVVTRPDQTVAMLAVGAVAALGASATALLAQHQSTALTGGLLAAAALPACAVGIACQSIGQLLVI